MRVEDCVRQDRKCEGVAAERGGGCDRHPQQQQQQRQKEEEEKQKGEKRMKRRQLARSGREVSPRLGWGSLARRG